jgi:1-acyl-sn-glycerol-3-phosphate acyltransferase
MARLALHLFYRQIEIEAAENVPRSGPVLFVSNHANSLIDPLLILVSTQRIPQKMCWREIRYCGC